MANRVSDIKNAEHNPTADAKKVILMGVTSGGSYVELRVDSNGVLQTV